LTQACRAVADIGLGRRLGCRLLAALAIVAMLQTDAHACSTFCTTGQERPLFGRNADAASPIPGFLVVNKRGVEKHAMSWGLLGPGRANQPVLHWTSKYGSVTATVLGREFPDGGINEAGLAIEEMSLAKTRYPQREGRPTIANVQWIQFVLDRFATVDEVLGSLDDVDLTGWGWHFTVADRRGACATIEFLDGRSVVARNEPGAPCVLTNNPRTEALADLAATKPAASSADSDSSRRFARLSLGIAAKPPSEIEDAFALLREVGDPSHTIRSFVHDLSRRVLYFRTAAHPAVKWVDLARLNFGPESEVVVLDLDTDAVGDVTGTFVRYRADRNRANVTAFFDTVVDTPALRSLQEGELQAAKTTRERFIAAIAAFPDTTRARRR
jgi:penicillin V acylase-like amidase (Ntn superfamily)